MSYIKLLDRLKSSPTGVLVVGIFSTYIFIISGYRLAIKPQLEKSRRQEAESLANFIYEQELSRTNEGKRLID